MASPSCFMMWKRSSTWIAPPACSASTLRYGCHRSLHTNRKPEQNVWPQQFQPAPQAVFGPLAPDPQQPPAAGVDLIDERQVVMAASPLDLVDADGFDTATNRDAPGPRPPRAAPSRGRAPRWCETRWPLPSRRAAWPSRPGTIGRPSSAAICRSPRERVRPPRRSADNRRVAGHRRTPRRSATAARTRSA